MFIATVFRIRTRFCQTLNITRTLCLHRVNHQSMSDIKSVACTFIDENKNRLNDLSQDIWKTPELGFQEFHAHEVLTKFLEKNGFDVTRKYKIDTAFRAVYGEGKPHIAVICEYDALPNIGHACGHNLIAEVGVATGIAIKEAMSTQNLKCGKLSVIGTPAEEGKCGKSYMIAAGVFNDVDVAMMAHPSQFTLSKPLMVAMTPVNIRFTGKASHASSFPWDGVNALDAAVTCYNNISCMRQQMKPMWRAMGIIKKGGDVPNIIPNEAELEYYLSTPTDEELNILKEKFVGCIEGAATATGCKATYKFADHFYSALMSNNRMAKLFEENASSIGVHIDNDLDVVLKYGGATDMGNVSRIVPSIHPKYYIGTKICNHNEGFTTASGDPAAQPYTLAISKALAMTALDIYTNPAVLKEIKEEFSNITQ
ncbi:peptidase M20 domain-containing protein 2-like [Mytilus trossulus]|uniref:peptidase M20 domain-containing protein 2-like n=1 Tax=Mytilus trossulus TaxID=6551 RepID=UPI003003F539